ncbi:hypothetical protein Taro_000251, partial [Colocasia esculenta]|nr:hypothetical protein [Colocasia esculenta]
MGLLPCESTLDQVVSTPCSKHKTKIGKTGQVVSTLVQVVSTQCLKYKTKRSSGVDTSPVSTLDQVVSTPCSKHKTKTGETGQVVSTLVQVVSTQCLKYKTKSSQKLSGSNWGSVSTLDGVVSTLEGFQNTIWAVLGQQVDTSTGSVDTSGFPRTQHMDPNRYGSQSQIDQQADEPCSHTFSIWNQDNSYARQEKLENTYKIFEKELKTVQTEQRSSVRRRRELLWGIFRRSGFLVACAVRVPCEDGIRSVDMP